MNWPQIVICRNSIHLNSIAVPNIELDELLVKVWSASLCHSDLMLFEPNEQGLLRAGSKTEGFREGDIVIFLCIVDCCYDCEGCQLHSLFCERETSKVQGLGVDGYFQPYIAVHDRNTVKLPQEMDPTMVAPLGCAGVISFNAVEDCKVRPGDWLAIVGCGGLGHLGIQYAKAMGLNVIGIDISNTSLAEAKIQGADYCFNPINTPDYAKKIKAFTNRGCHTAINFTNSFAAYASIPDLLRPSGIFIVVGIPLQPLTFKAVDISLVKYRVQGSYNGTTPRLKKCIEFSQRHGIRPHVEHFKLEQIHEMIEMMKSGSQRGRMAVIFD